MRDGKLVNCYLPSAYKQLSRRYGSSLTESFISSMEDEGNYLKIEDIKSIDDVNRFVISRKRQCDYCAIRERRNMGTWMRSKGQKDEWLDLEERGKGEWN